MIFPRTVAMAAPAAPWFNPKIKIGSKMIFTMEPIKFTMKKMKKPKKSFKGLQKEKIF